MSIQAKVNPNDDITAEVAWLAKMPASGPLSAVIEISVRRNAIRMRRTDFELFQEAEVRADADGDATIYIAASKLSNALNQVSGPLTFTINAAELVIESSNAAIELRGADVDFPKWPQFKSDGRNDTVAVDLIGQVLTSVGTDPTLPALTVVGFDNGTMVTTDRFRLSALRYAKEGIEAKVPSAALKAFAKCETVVYVVGGSCAAESGRWIRVQTEGRQVWAAQPDTQFPQWSRLMPEDAPILMWADRNLLLKAIAGDEVAITFDREKITVVGESDGLKVRKYISSPQVNRFDGEPVTVSICSKYVTAALKGTNSAQVVISVTAADKPVQFADITGTERHLVMPIRKPQAASVS